MNESLLYATRDLSLMWLPAGFANPSLHRDQAGSLRWYYRCDLTFLSWVLGVANRAGARLTADQRGAIDFVTSHVCARNGILDTADLPEPGARLPTDAQAEFVSLYDAELAPSWPGMRAFAQAHGIPTEGGSLKPLGKNEEFVVPGRVRTLPE